MYQLGTEQIVGTWIDGKKIYRKTFEQTYTVTANTAFSGSMSIAPDSGVISSIVDLSIRVDDQFSTDPGLTVDCSSYYSSSSNYVRVFARTQGSSSSLQIRAMQPSTKTSKLTATVYYTKS